MKMKFKWITLLSVLAAGSSTPDTFLQAIEPNGVGGFLEKTKTKTLQLTP